MKTGDTFTLPECPYSGKFQVFGGWSVNGVISQPGDEVTVEGYTDYDIKATWSDEVLIAGEAQDDYKFSFVQDATVPLTLYCNGTVKLDGLDSKSSSGTWEITGSGSAATLVIKNEKGEPVGAKDVDGVVTYVQKALYYDWGQPDVGYGSGIFYATYTHRILASDLLASYNKVFGTSYSTLDVTTGSAIFAEQDDPTVPSKKTPW